MNGEYWDKCKETRMDEEAEYWTDSKYKQFASSVDKTLKSFEYSSEWADLISCLGKLNKVRNLVYAVIIQ